MNTPRRMEPEWLNDLPAEDPRAIRSRRDLRLINRLMFQTRIMARLLAHPERDRAPHTVVELGGGDGTFMLGVARRLARIWPDVSVIVVDRQDIMTETTRRSFRDLGWRAEVFKSDIFDFLDGADENSADIVTANLFLHHFSESPLARLFAGIARLTRMFVACEPERSAAALLSSRLLFAVGANDVTRHDAVVSVRAGFRGRELSRAWPNPDRWDIAERAMAPFTHGFTAWRRT